MKIRPLFYILVALSVISISCQKLKDRSNDKVVYTCYVGEQLTGMGGNQLFVMTPGENGEVNSITGFQESSVAHINLSPDGKKVVFAEMAYNYTIKWVELTGGEPITVASNGATPDFIDNQTIVYSTSNQLIKTDLNGENQEVLFDSISCTGGLKVSPDGTKILLFESYFEKYGNFIRLICLDIENKQKTILSNTTVIVDNVIYSGSASTAGMPFWGPNSDYVYFNYENSYTDEKGFFRIKTDSSDREKLYGSHLYNPNLTYDRKILSVNGESILQMDLDGNNMNTIYSLEGYTISMAVKTPTSDHFVFSSKVYDKNVPYELYSVKEDGLNLHVFAGKEGNVTEMKVYNGF
ncbi:MAG: hypothetical protein JXB17_04290 [Bacteroidales bacterium]|nr:hypothetical protein [Bacteroidales bacterium]